jgi:succinate dehydrogenase/fumarate reductase cytochrome b subunit
MDTVELDQPVGKSDSSWPPHYRKALLISSTLSILQQMTGINAVTFFSNEIFKNGNFLISYASIGESGNEAEMKARIGTFIVGIAAFFGTLTSIPLLK